ncbi:MAG: response regulator, partial [Eubacteriales bacterium]|nr:response regulator [Eubacteriales bacterium]
MNFLVVEDEYYARKALAQSVQHWQQSAVVDEAENGLAALDMLSRKSYDVALLDIKMPRMNGLDLAERMQSVCPQTYKIMITGYGEFEYAQAAIRFNVSDYLLKPVDDDKLCDSLIRAQE